MRPRMRSTARRAFLRGAGLGAFALPFVRAAHGLAAPPLKNLVFFFTPNGTIMDEFFPRTGFELGRILKPIETSAPALKSKLVVMRGIDHKSAMMTPVPPDHGPDYANALIARQAPAGHQPGGISIDQHIANAFRGQTKIHSLQLGIYGQYENTQMVSARGFKQPLMPVNDPYKVFDLYFKDIVADPAQFERIKAEKQSIADIVKGEISDLRCALGAEDRPKFDLHMESIRELERGLEFVVPNKCKPNLGAPLDPRNDRLTDTLLNKQIDNIVAALSCGLTRVVIFVFRNGGSNLIYDFPGGPNTPGHHHNLAHGLFSAASTPAAERLERLIRIDAWHAQKFASLISKLDATPQVGGGGTLLDTSAVLWCHEQSNGFSHSRGDMPYVLAGSLGGAFKTGRAINFRGKAHNGLLISLANAMDVPTPSFGDPLLSSGPLAEL